MPLKDESRARLRAVAHPVRIRMLSLLTGAAASATELATELDLTHANASYHLRQLFDAGLIDLVGTEVVRGGQVKRYRYRVDATPPGPREPAGPLGPEHHLYLAVLADELRRRSAQLLADAPSTFTDAELWVDPAIWADLRERIGQASVDLHLAAQAPRTPGTQRVSATIALFAMTEK